MSTEPQPHRCAVLVVDDDSEVVELLRVALGADYEIDAAANGREALYYLRSHVETCAILLELQLPIMDGAQFRSAQLRDRSLAWIPIVVMSATVDGSRRARELGAKAFVPKPLDIDDVRAALRRLGCWQSGQPLG